MARRNARIKKKFRPSSRCARFAIMSPKSTFSRSSGGHIYVVKWLLGVLDGTLSESFRPRNTNKLFARPNDFFSSTQWLRQVTVLGGFSGDDEHRFRPCHIFSKKRFFSGNLFVFRFYDHRAFQNGITRLKNSGHHKVMLVSTWRPSPILTPSSVP